MLFFISANRQEAENQQLRSRIKWHHHGGQSAVAAEPEEGAAAEPEEAARRHSDPPTPAPRLGKAQRKRKHTATAASQCAAGPER